ncbi:Cullin repeat-containing protein [Mytilinidion resinicola]|uniref:Cullin repeat-containing protein n=1 Tax=Mytilinidion resinicola TaxID=574789 RepID=A0A6A6YY34_9PEZI|nr:Cullin repeat-containing protein [Mytilinidion resinicola]KAF2813832.1 Cullin repeat-containing protein [Mytilinidion resinicola]
MDDVEARWNHIETGVKKIMTDVRGGIDFKEHMKNNLKAYFALYTSIHKFCVVPGPASFARAEYLYEHLTEYLSSHLKGVQARSKEYIDDALLSFYITEWHQYRTAAECNNWLFQYLNRHWIKDKIKQGRKDIYTVITLHLVRWKEDVFINTQESLVQAILKLIERQRNGEMIEKSRIKPVIESFGNLTEPLDLDESDESKSTVDFCKEYFQEPFLKATTEYYDTKSKLFLAENNVAEYMKMAEACLEEEEERVSPYLHDDTKPLLMQKYLGRLQGRFSTHVRKAGLAAVEEVAREDDNLEPEVYAEALHKTHAQYQSLVNHSFNGDSGFMQSVDNACREFVNRNKICLSGSNKSAELLAKYTDTVLKRSILTMATDDRETRLTQIITLFKYIEDKDVFQKHYSEMLAERLKQNILVSNRAEKRMISKLGEVCY